VKSHSLDALLNPNSIAIIGASEDTDKISGRPIEYLKRYGFSGEIYPVNPKRETVQGLRCYPAVSQILGQVDLAIIAIPGRSVIPALQECVQQGVRSCIVFSSGFAELGEEGKRIQKQISEVASQSGMRVLGPNCQGVANLHVKSIACFSTSFAEGDLFEGHSAIVSQSGAVAAMVYSLQKQWFGGIKYWIATGNEADLTVAEFLDKILEDTDVRVVQAYMEDIKDGEALLAAARKAQELEKPILALKAGRTSEGKKAASSHTGALAGEDTILDAVFRQCGIVRVRDIVELACFPQVFAQRKKARGRNVAILSNSGGLGVMMVDQCKELGLELAKLSESTVTRLGSMLPDFASAANPIDVTAQLLSDKNLLSNALPVLIRDPNVDIILFGLGIMGKGYDIPTILQDIAVANQESPQVMAVSWVGGQEGVVGQFASRGVPAFENPSMCVTAVAKYADYCLALNSEPLERTGAVSATNTLGASLPFSKYRTSSIDGFLSEHKSKEILREWGLPVSRETLVASEEEAVTAANAIGYPVAVKLSSAIIQHKTDSGALALNVQNDRQLRSLSREMLESGGEQIGRDRIEGLLIQEMLQEGFEVSLGVRRDPIFGPILMVASGGIYIEVLKDFQLLVPPVGWTIAMRAVRNLTSFPILEGARGRDVLDVDALCETIVSLSRLVAEAGTQIEEMDLNPVFVMKKGDGVKIVDALVKLSNNR
jgi:acetate---CoA ligase (ADP-forming)